MMNKHRFILPRIKEAFDVLRDLADYNGKMIDRDTLNNIYSRYRLDKVWLKDEDQKSAPSMDATKH